METSRPRAILLGLMIVIAAQIMKAGLDQALGGDVGYLPLFALLPVATIVGGPWAGVTVSLVGALVDALLFQLPRATGAELEPGIVARLLLFIPIGLWLTWIVSSVLRLRRQAAHEAERLEAMVEALPDFALLVEATSGRIRFVNGVFESVGWKAGELIGRPVGDVLPDFTTPADHVAASRPIALGLVSPTGSEVSVEVLVRSVELAAGEPGLLISARDSTTHVESEVQLLRLAAQERQVSQTLRAIIGSMEAGVAVIDGGGNIAFENDALTELADGPVATRAALVESLGVDLVTGDIRQSTPARWLRITTHDMEGAELVIIRDTTTERDRAAAQDAFIGILGHELRTPITTILGLADLISRPEGLKDIRYEELGADILHEADRLNRLVEDLLVLSRVQSDQLTFEPEPVLVQHAIAITVRAEAERFPNIAFDLEIPGDLPPVEGDETFLRQVLQNLVGNAAKYGPTGPARVRITVQVHQRWLEIRVLDDGPGFEESDAERLFDIFFRSSHAARTQSGSGIGLYVTKTLVEAMHGRVWARRRAEGGSEFGFALPILTSDEIGT